MEDIPATPVRKLLNKIPTFRDSGRQGRKRAGSTSLPQTPSHTQKLDEVPRPMTDPNGLRSKRARLAIQQHDEGHDAVIVTTLPDFPFCCHEDLVTMSRSRLLHVADLFNSRLPSPTRIPYSKDSTDTDLRHSIEKLVGISVENSPKIATTSEPQDLQISPPSSPLAMHVPRKLKRDISWIEPFSNSHQSLHVLHEEDEPDVTSFPHKT